MEEKNGHNFKIKILKRNLYEIQDYEFYFQKAHEGCSDGRETQRHAYL